MSKRDGLTKGLAILGTALLWLPIVATIGFSAMRGFMRLDWLMPAELFPAAFIGGALLLWAAIRAHARRGLIGWGLGIAVAALAGGQGLAVVTGLASGASSPATAPVAWIALLGTLGLYTAAVVAMGVTGVLLIRDLSGHASGHAAAHSA